MTKALYRRTPTGFAPADEGAHKYWARFAIGDQVMLDIRRPRSLPQHNLFWALAQIAADNNPGCLSGKDEAADCIKMACGLTKTTHIKYEGKWYVRKAPASIAFESMPQDEFNEFFEKAIAYVCAELVPGLDPETLEMEVRAA